PFEVGIARLQPERASQRDLFQIEAAMHPWIGDLRLPKVDHSSAALGFVGNDGWRLLVPGPHHLASPDRQSIEHALANAPKAAHLPSALPSRQAVCRVAVEPIEIGANYRRFLQSGAIIAHQKRD